jgi:hypothetical protein
MKDIQLVKSDIDKILEDELNGAIIRSKSQFYEHDNKATKFFLNLEKNNYNKKTLRKVKKGDHEIVNTKGILQHFESFYTNLYTSPVTKIPEEIKQFLSDIKCKTMQENEKTLLETDVTERELLNILKVTKNNKSPGSDGIPSEFYKFFWKHINPFFLDSVKEVYRSESLTTSQKQGIITLQPKKDKDLSFVKNWRPITLLNLDLS